MEKLRVVIFCGGFGTRMWPMSRKSLPKQFQPLLGEKSFFEDTLERVKLAFAPKDIFVSVPQEQKMFIRKQAPEIPQNNIIAEPERRDTLGAVGFATAFFDKYFPNSLMAACWQDHFVREKERFARLLTLAGQVCEKQDVICKIDVRPPYPATQLGWVEVGKPIGTIGGYEVLEFKKFIEKPDLTLAKKLFANKNYLINAGYFVWRTTTMLNLFKQYSPAAYGHLRQIQSVLGEKKEEAKLKKEYHLIEKTSIDYGLFEKLPSGSFQVIPADLGWHDVGTWDLLYEALARGQRQNIAKGEVNFLDSQGNLVYLPKGKIAAVIGLENLVIIDTPDGLLVCRRGASAEVKKFVESLKGTKGEKYL